MIRRFVADVVVGRHPHWTQVCASPLVANVASCRALAKAGFTVVAAFRDAHGPCCLMALDRQS